jgi:flagellin
LQSQINGANQGIRNMNDAISMVQTAEGAIAAASDMAQRILTLATQGANGTLGDAERTSIKAEMQQLIKSIDSITSRTSYAGNDLLVAGPTGNASFFSMQISNDSNDKINLSSEAFRNIGQGSEGAATYTKIAAAPSTPSAVGTTTSEVFIRTGQAQYSTGQLEQITTFNGTTYSSTFKLDGVNYTFAAGSIDIFDRTLTGGAEAGMAKLLSDTINGAATTGTAATSAFASIQAQASQYVADLGVQRSLLGSYQNQMEYTLSNITELSANLSASKSRVIDTDYASETAALTRGQILQQAATAMLAQANQMPNVILTLLK